MGITLRVGLNDTLKTQPEAYRRGLIVLLSMSGPHRRKTSGFLPLQKVLRSIHLRDHDMVFQVQVGQATLHSELPEKGAKRHCFLLVRHNVKIALQSPRDCIWQDFVTWQGGKSKEKNQENSSSCKSGFQPATKD